MMEKLLHERLREWSPEDGSACFADFVNGYETFVDHCISDCPTCASNAAKKLADEIERYYIPRPRDDKGELWKVDDPCIAKGEEGTVAGFDGEEFINVCSNSSHVHFWCDKRYVKRPTPKVYDADVVAYKCGETVWHVKGSNPWKVLDVSNKGIKVEDPLCSHDTEVFDASSLTHREPDSLEKLRDDMNTFVAAKHPASSETLGGYCDRLTALIERGA